MPSDSSQLSQWLNLELQFEQNNYNGASHGIASKFTTGKDSSVVLAAVHAVNHHSGPHDSDHKVADLFTGGLVLCVGASCSASTLVNVRRDSSINPHIGETVYEQLLWKHLDTNPEARLLDIHGAKDNETFDIAIGTAENIPNADQESMIEMLRSCAGDFRIAVNPPSYTAASTHTLTSRAINRGFRSALQVEIIRRFRDPLRDNAGALAMLNMLTRYSVMLNNL